MLWLVHVSILHCSPSRLTISMKLLGRPSKMQALWAHLLDKVRHPANFETTLMLKMPPRLQLAMPAPNSQASNRLDVFTSRRALAGSRNCSRQAHTNFEDFR